MCMLRHKVSIIDGHQEYTMQCVDKMVCDSRRALGKRDVTTHCCSDDFCNDPNPRTTPLTTATTTPLTTATTTTLTTLSTQAPINQIVHRTCARDIAFIVDESIGSGHTFGREAGKQFIHNIVSAFTIGHDHTLMALFTTSLVSLKVWGFQSYTSQSSLLRAIDDLNVKIGFIANINDPMAGIHAYVDQTRSGEIQNRPNVPDVVIVMTWENWDPQSHFLLTGSYPEYYLPSFHSLTRNVIALGAGNDVSDTQLQQIATNGHWFRIQNENKLFSAQNEVTRIICE
ncbi:uncharacterized protein LOC128243942 [Mya arenaria]|uniref:uncharacterized protein LOC128243942 n=1 Tax=Mya arenaria TaxID=6604 RepID=UPI0022E47475|nr:uncharacterized protein LOC128243942 [Mya arenaria]